MYISANMLRKNFYGDSKWYLENTSSFLPISDLQTELARKGHETQEEQKRMTELVEKLQSQLSQNECDLKSKLSKFCSKNITFRNNRNVIAFVTNLKYSIQIDRISLF